MSTYSKMGYSFIGVATILTFAQPTPGYTQDCDGQSCIGAERVDESAPKTGQIEDVAAALNKKLGDSEKECAKPLTAEDIQFLDAVKQAHQDIMNGVKTPEEVQKELAEKADETSQGNADVKKKQVALGALADLVGQEKDFARAVDNAQSGKPPTQQDLTLMEKMGKTQGLFNDDGTQTGPETLVQAFTHDLSVLKKYGATVGKDGIDLSSFKFDRLAKNPEAETAFATFFPEAITQMKDLANPKRSTAIQIGNQMVMPSLYKSFKEHDKSFDKDGKFVAAMSVEQYRAELAATLNDFSVNMGTALQESKSQHSVFDMFAFWKKTSDNVNSEHNEKMVAAEEGARKSLEKTALKYGIPSDKTHAILKEFQDTVNNSNTSVEQATKDIQHKMYALIVAPAAVYAMGAYLGAGVIYGGFASGAAFGLGSAAIDAGAENHYYGGGFVCRMEEQLDEQGPTSLLFAAAMAPIGVVAKLGKVGKLIGNAWQYGMLAYGGVTGGWSAYKSFSGAGNASKAGETELAKSMKYQGWEGVSSAAQSALFAFGPKVTPHLMSGVSKIIPGIPKLIGTKMAFSTPEQRIAIADHFSDETLDMLGIKRPTAKGGKLAKGEGPAATGSADSVAIIDALDLPEGGVKGAKAKAFQSRFKEEIQAYKEASNAKTPDEQAKAETQMLKILNRVEAKTKTQLFGEDATTRKLSDTENEKLQSTMKEKLRKALTSCGA